MAEKAKPTPNHKLRYERERRGWSQQDLADKIGTTPLNVSRWERGVTLPGPHFRQRLSEVFEKSMPELGLAQQPIDTPQAAEALSTSVSLLPEAAPTLVWNVPYNRNLLFTGREDILTQIHNAFLQEPQPVALSQPQALSGLGGIGKTQTAVEYAYRYRESYQFVLWARAESAELLTSDFLTIATLLNLPQRNEQDQAVIVNAVKRWFDTHDGWLLILDNADHLEVVSQFLPAAGQGHVLLTTRANSTGTLAQRVEIEKMALDEGMAFLLRRAKGLKGTVGLESLPEPVRAQARSIVESLDGLPLALDQAGAYIEETGCTLGDYLKFFKTRSKRLLRLRGQHAIGHPEPVATTWSLAFEKVERANPAAAELLRLCAFLHPDEIPEAIMIEGASELGPVLQAVAEDELEWNEAVGEIRKYSLVKRDPDEKLLNIHRLVQAVIRDGMTEEEQGEWAERTVRTVNRVFPEVEFTTWIRCRHLIPHAQVCVGIVEQLGIMGIDTALLLSKIGDYLQAREQYGDAERLYQRSLEVRKSLLGIDTPLVADCITSLAEVYYEQGRYMESEQMYQQALSIREQVLGPIHLGVADVLNGMGQLYWQWTKYRQGEEALLRSLHIRQQALGLHHSDVADCLNNLALIYLYQGKYSDAAPLFEQAAAMWEHEAGSQHPSTLICMTNVGITYGRLGKYAQSERILTEVLHRREQLESTVGPRHFDMGQSLFNLGVTYGEMGKYMLAETLHKQALVKWEQTVGPDHPRVASILASLGSIYRIQGKLAWAIPLYERALAIRKSVAGSETVDIEVANCINGLAEIARMQGKYQEAASLYERALAIREQMAGSESVLVAQTLNGLASLAYKLGNYSKAELLFQRALSIRESNLGKTHPHVAYTLGCMALLHSAQGRNNEAESLFQCVLTMQEESLEPGHPHIVETLENYAKLLHQMNREAEAAKLEARAQTIRTMHE